MTLTASLVEVIESVACDLDSSDSGYSQAMAAELRGALRMAQGKPDRAWTLPELAESPGVVVDAFWGPDGAWVIEPLPDFDFNAGPAWR